MPSSRTGRWSKLFGKRRPRDQARPRPGGAFFRPNFEHLEDRIAPATYVWTGAGADALWSDANNWTLNGAPAAPVTNGTADLVFPGGAAQITTTNNNFVGAAFHSIAIDAAGTTLGGNALTLGAGGLSVNSAAGSGSDIVNTPIVLGASTAITDTYAGVSLQLNSIDTGASASGFVLTLGGSGNITVPNGITDGGSLVKSGPGTLVVPFVVPSGVPATSAYTGSTTISAGTLQLAANASLGSSVLVSSGATLQLAPLAILNQPITLNGTGVGGGLVNSTVGALEAQGTATVNGAITLGSDATIGVDASTLTVNINPVALAGHTLTVNAASGATATFIKALNGGVANAGALVVNSAFTGGTVTLNTASTFTGATTVDAGILDLGGANGSLVSNSVTVNDGATLLLDNSSGTSPIRLPSLAASALNLDGGTLNLLSGANAVTETVNAIKLIGGQSNIRLNTGVGLPAILQAGSLVRSAGATLNVSSNNNNATLGTASAKVLFTTAPATISVANGSGKLLPYVTVGDTDLATYGATGVAAFTGYIVNPTTFNPLTDTTDVVKYTSSATLPTPASGLTVTYAGLVISGGSTLTVPVGINLTLGSGGLLLNHASIVPAGLLGGNMTFSSEGVIYSNASSGANSISTQITGTHGMDLAGPAISAASTNNYLYLNPGTARNTWTGGTWIDSANVGLAGTNPLSTATVTIVGGGLTTATAPGAANQLSGSTLSNAIVLASANTTLNANNLTLSGTIGLAGSDVLTVLQPATLNGVISNNAPASPAGFVELGSSVLTLAPGLGKTSNTYTGGTVVGAGTLDLATTGNPLGTGTLTLTGTAASATTLQNSVAGISLINSVLLSNPAAAAGSPNVTLSGAGFTLSHPVLLTGLTTLQVNAPVTISGAMSGTGGLTVTGSSSLVLTGNNSYTGATMLEGAGLTINGIQGNSPVAVVNGTLTGAGTIGFLSVGPTGTVTPSNPAASPAAKGVLTAPGANFSEGGSLTLQIAGTTTAGTNYSRLNLGSGPLIVGGNAATAPSILNLDLTGLASTNEAAGAIVYGSQLGTQSEFEQLDILNNPNDFAASLDYTPAALNVILTPSTNTKADLAPKTTFIWTGASTTTNRWSDPANWLNDAAPTKNDDLVFPAGAAQLTNIDDLAAGIAIDSITIEAGGYTLNPLNSTTPIDLAAGLTTTEPPDASANPLPTTDTVNIPLTLVGVMHGAASASTIIESTNAGTTLVLGGAIVTSGSNLVVDGSGTTTVSGLISGAGGVVKDGTGTLNLWPASGAGNSFTGPSTLNAGITTFNLSSSLGDFTASGQNTTVATGATLESVGSNAIVLAEPLNLSGTGVGGGVPGTSLGALDVNNTGSLTLTGGVNLLATATIDNPNPNTQLDIVSTPIALDNGTGNGSPLTINTASAGASSAVNITVPIKGNDSGSTFTINSDMTPGTGTAAKPNLYNGVVTLTGASTYTGATIIDAGTLDVTGNGTLKSTNIVIGTDAAQNASGPLALFEIDDRSVNPANGRLIGSSPVLTFDGGEFLMLGAGGTATSEEVIDHIVLAGGQSLIQMTHGSGTKCAVELNMDHITRDAGATINFAGADFGSSQCIVELTNAAAPTQDASNQIFPYATVTAAGQETTYATYIALGTKPQTYQIVAFTTYSAGNITGDNPTLVGEVTANTILRIPAGTTTTLAALRIDGGGTVYIEPGATLDLQSGLLTAGNGGAYIGQDPASVTSPAPVLTIGGGETSKDATPNEGVVMSYTPTALVAQLTDDKPDSSFTGYTFAGTSETLLAPPTGGSSYTGDTYIASGTVLLETDNTPFGSPTMSTLHLDSGVLAFDAGANGLNSTSVSILNNIAMNGGLAEFLPINLAAGTVMNVSLGSAGTTNTLTLAGGDVLAIPANTDLVVNDQVTGAGALYVLGGGAGSGAGVLTLTNATNNYSGGTDLSPSGIWGPTLLVTNATALGTGTLRLVGGTIEANTSVTIANALDLESANVTLGGSAPNNGAIIFGGAVTLTGVNNVVTAPNLFTVVPPAPALVYDNGPINGTLASIAISQGGQISDSFTLSQTTNLTGVQFGVDLHHGDQLTSVGWTISTGPTGDGVGDGNQPIGIIASGTATTSTTFQSNDSIGDDLDEINFTLNTTLPAGTYYLSLQNAVVTGGHAAVWDMNNGPSTAFGSKIGNLANTTGPGTTGSESFQLFGFVPPPVPVYDNGPPNGAIDGFTINGGFEVSDSFTLSQTTNLTGAQFGVDLFPGDTVSSVGWLISTGPTGNGVGDGTQPTGIIASGTTTTGSTFQANVSGFDVDEITFPLGITLAPGTYYLSLQNAVVTNGDPAFWDENNGPSTAFDSAIGNLANFDVPGTTGSESFQLYSAPSIATPVVISGNISGTGALNVSGTIILSGAKSTQSGFTAATPGPLEIDGSQPSSPVPVTGSTPLNANGTGGTLLDGNGTAGIISVGSNGIVEPGTPAAVGELTAGGANFSDNGTLHLRIAGTTTPGTDYDVLNLSGGTLVLGGTSTLMLDLAGLSGITTATTVTGVILYGSPPPAPFSFMPAVIGRIGNTPVFNRVQIINNPNNYAVELDYTTTASGQPELNLVIAQGAPDVPTLNVPGSSNLPSTPKNVPLQFGNGNSYGISVSDLEGAAPYSAQFQATISIPASAGTLSLAAGSPGGPLTSVLIGSNQVLTFPIGSGATSLANLNADLAGLTYNPAYDFTGSVVMSVTVTNEGSTALLPGAQTVSTTLTITVLPELPSFVEGSSELVAFTSGGPNSFSFSPWATQITAEPAPPSFAGQTSLFFTLTSDDPSLFTATGQPAVDPSTGILTFTLANPLPPVLVAHVNIVLSEQLPHGDVDSSAAQTFTITATTTAPPTITDIIVHWGKEKASLLSMLNPVSASNPYGGRIDIPFANINAIDIVFSQSLSPTVAASALKVLGKFYTYTLSAPTFLNSYTLEYKLTGNVLGGLSGVDDVTLNFTGSAVSAQGNGLHLTTNFTKTFSVVVGDVDNSGTVDLYDQLAVVRSLNIVDVGIPYLDVAGDGLIDMNDYNLVRKYTGNRIM